MRTLIAACVLAMATSAPAQGPSERQAPARYVRARESDTLNVGLTLIKADNSGRTDPSLGGLDSTLRGVLRFTGYRGIAGGASLAFPGKTFDITFKGTDSLYLRVFCTVERLNTDVSPATAQLRVRLARVDTSNTTRTTGPDILTTVLTIPEDHVVVVGSGAYAESALALTVRWRKGAFRKRE